MAEAQQGKSAVTLKRNDLIVECFFNENGKLSRKVERYDRQSTQYAYQYDAKGHLTKVQRDGTATESYQYNQSGQRVEQTREYRGFSDASSGMLRYDDEGRLSKAGDTSFYYDKHGALSERCDCQGITKYSYGKDTMPDKVILPSRAEIRYEYDKQNPTGPARRFRNNTLTAEFAWSNPVCLKTYRDHDNLLEYTFLYDDSGILNKIRIDMLKPEKQKNGAGAAAAGSDVPNNRTAAGSDMPNNRAAAGWDMPGNRAAAGWDMPNNRAAAGSDALGSMVALQRRHRLHDFLGKRPLPLELLCGCDQVGTLKILTDKSGRLVKEIVRDSFGVQQSDSFPDLFMPIGFAGGLTDPDTHLVRFGYRDYDPSTGRFTALDPAKDRRGDGDLYDYCVDDPVTAVDPTGLMGCRPQFRVDEDQRMQTPPAQTQGQAASQTPAQTAMAQQQQPAQQQQTAQAAPGDRPDVRRWTYNQRTGQLRDPDGVLDGDRGYSGIRRYRNNPEAQGRRDEGPIPQGPYIIGNDVGTRGPRTLELNPDGHDALGRRLLRIHGDSRQRPGDASTGCIILNRRQRETIHNSRDRQLMVVDEPEWQQ